METDERLIDANKLENHRFSAQESLYNSGWNDAIDAIMENAPTVDAVEVVRCKDCAHCEKLKKWHGGDYFGCRRIPSEVHEVEPDHFCSYGERRTVHV